MEFRVVERMGEIFYPLYFEKRRNVIAFTEHLFHMIDWLIILLFCFISLFIGSLYVGLLEEMEIYFGEKRMIPSKCVF